MMDAGQYQCIATNSNGSAVSNYATVLVEIDGECSVLNLPKFQLT